MVSPCRLSLTGRTIYRYRRLVQGRFRAAWVFHRCLASSVEGLQLVRFCCTFANHFGGVFIASQAEKYRLT
jgi:hypothetical protein